MSKDGLISDQASHNLEGQLQEEKMKEEEEIGVNAVEVRKAKPYMHMASLASLPPAPTHLLPDLGKSATFVFLVSKLAGL